MMQDEEFYDVSGTLGYNLEGEEGTTTEGVYIPLGKQHTFWNADPTKDLQAKVRYLLSAAVW